MKLWQWFTLFSTIFTTNAVVAGDNILDVDIKPLLGKEPVNLQKHYKGKVLLIVNVASKCGFTYQYEGLEKMYQKYRNQGFEILGFPCNQFLGQEPGSEEEIQEFCQSTYGVEFPLFEKIKVKGKNAHPLYQRLKSQAGKAPKWNFHKYLIGKDGKLIAHYGSRTKPEDKKLIKAIETALSKK